jgi:hypothetical protein
MTPSWRDRPGLWWLGTTVGLLAATYCVSGYLMSVWLTATPSAAPRHVTGAYAFLTATVVCLALSACAAFRGFRARGHHRRGPADSKTSG